MTANTFMLQRYEIMTRLYLIEKQILCRLGSRGGWVTLVDVVRHNVKGVKTGFFATFFFRSRQERK